MNVYSFDPLHDPRWAELVGRHPKASVFHTSGWLRALQRTYRFQPLAFTTSRPAEELRNAIVCCAVRSWLTGRRLVSLPFSDHCEPLVDTNDELSALCGSLRHQRSERRWKYVELRPASSVLPLEVDFQPTQTFYLHRIDLRPDLDALLDSFHKNSIQRKIRRAERERLTYEEGRSESLLRRFCQLLELTRRRHHAPLQPLAWFRNLLECLGENVSIRVASWDGVPAAAVLTLAYRDRVVYKYGGSDSRLHPLGGMPLLFWKTIQDAKRSGARELDLGRSDCDNAGLIAFKDRWGADRSKMTYWRFPVQSARLSDGWPRILANRLFPCAPLLIRRTAGRLLYRHFA